MIYLLSMLLFVIATINYKISSRDLFNPSCVVTGVFWIFSVFASLANIYIGIDIDNIITIIIVVTGMLIFTIINYYQIGGCCKNSDITIKHDITLGSVFNILSVIVMLVTVYINYRFIVDFAAAYGKGGDFIECMWTYKTIMTFSDPSQVLVLSPWYRNIMANVATGFAYFSMYVFFRDKILYDNVNYLHIVTLILFFLYGLMGGGRSNAFRMITSMLFMWGYFKTIKCNQSFNLRNFISLVTPVVGVITMFFLYFQTIIRDMYFDIEYVLFILLVYTAMPIFNLDIFFDNPWAQTHGIFGEMTFVRIINWLGKQFNISSWQYELDLPFQSYGGYELGNVYTTFYPFYLDFGFAGVVILTLFMAIFSLWMYRKVYSKSYDESTNILWVVTYSYLINDLIMLPFSNRFYETVFNISTIYVAVVFYLLVLIIKYCKRRSGLR